MITVTNLEKDYRVFKRPPGLGAAFRALFHRKYETVHAVRDISFEIKTAERVGFLGPNGAGKTTTLKILSGLLHPTRGEVRVLGHVPQAREEAFLRKIMLIMGQKQQLMWDLPPTESFELHRAIYGVERTQFKRTIDELIGILELGDLVDKPTRELSLGERMKCELVLSLVHQPEVLFLDEPTIGLDVSMQVAIRDFVRRYNQQRGATLLLTSHYMDDVIALCPRIIVIDRGRLVFDGSIDTLVQTVAPEKRIVFRTSRPIEERDVAEFGRVVSIASDRVVVQVATASVARAVQGLLAKFPVDDLTVEDPPLEDVMRELYSRVRALPSGEFAVPDSSAPAGLP